MSTLEPNAPTRRVLIETGVERRDDLGFLDRGQTPRILEIAGLSDFPATWITAPPWLGKTTVAKGLYDWLRTSPTQFGGVGNRVALTELGLPGVDRDIPPAWWEQWSSEPEARPVAWIIDGLDEGVDHNDRLLTAIFNCLDRLSDNHRNRLRLVLFSRPHSGLTEFRDRLHSLYPPYTERILREFELARVDRVTAEGLVGSSDFPRVLDTIRRNQLESVAGYPIILGFLKRHPKADRLTLAEVWQGVLRELLGQSQRISGRPFETRPEERFEAACRIAAILTLTRRETIREYSPANDEPTIGSIFLEPRSNRLRLAARDVCRTAAFHALAEEGAYCFAQRNIQDWLTAFALADLPTTALTTALSDVNGRLLPRLGESARLIRVIKPDTELVAAIDRLTGGIDLPSDAVEPTLAQALTCLDRLEELAQEADWGLWLGEAKEEGLDRLGVPGLSDELVCRLSDPARPPQVKQLLIDIAEETKAVKAADPAVRLVLDPEEDGGLREKAMLFIARLGGDDHLRGLVASIGETPGSSDIDDRLRGILILELLKRGLWSIRRAAWHAPATVPRVTDSRAMLLYHIKQQMTVADARQILPHFLELLDRHSSRRGHRLPPFLNHALSLVRDQEGMPAEDINLLGGLVFGLLARAPYWVHARSIAQRLRDIPIFRRRLYQFDVERELRGEDSTTTGRRFLAPADCEWLRQKANGEWSALPDIWSDLYRISELARQDGQISPQDWDTLLAEIDRFVPGLPRQIEEARRRFEQQEEQWRAEQRRWETSEPEDRPLTDVVREILARLDLSAADKMRDLGYLCFHPNIRPDHITGTWDDLSEDLQMQVLSTCQAGLETGHPSPLSNDNTVSGATLGEAVLFDRFARLAARLPWLTDELIRRWLPISFRGVSLERWPDLIRACWSVSQAATEHVLVDAIEDQTRRHEQPSHLRMIPTDCWSGPLTERLIELICDESGRPRTRSELLETLAAHDLDRALPIAEEWAHRPPSSSPEDRLRQAGRNVLLCQSPTAVLDLIESEFDERGSVCLEELHVLHDGREDLRTEWRHWPLDSQERLAALLIRAYPFGEESEGEIDIERGNDLRIFRDAVIGALLQDPSVEHLGAVDQLANLDPHILQMVLRRRGSAAATQVIRASTSNAGDDPSALPLHTARQLLDRKDFRLVRSPDDLLDATLSALHRIQREVGHDLPLLYFPPEKGSAMTKDTTKRVAELERRHLHEDALQAYLRRRLRDVLAGVVEQVEVEILREDQVAYRRRFDLRVTAPCLGTQQLATVVIEIKWSTNPETKTGLVDQLGQKYLLGEQLRHGVFLVGWSGWWHHGQQQRKGRDLNKLVQFLLDQRDSFCGMGQPGEGVRIEPVVLDLAWRPSDTAKLDAGNQAIPAGAHKETRKRRK